MRSRAPLLLIEQLVMLMVFALAAALCLQAFVKADALSRHTGARDQAVIAAQSAAEAIRWAGGTADEALAAAAGALGGQSSEGLLWVAYDEKWQPCPGEGLGSGYLLRAYALEEGVPGLSSVQVEVLEPDGEELFRIRMAWQEVGADA